MLKQKLQDDLKTALKSGDSLRVSVIRLVLSAISYEFINKQHDLSDEEILAVLSKEAKKRRESIMAYTQGNRMDLANKEEKELVILNTYLPQQMTGPEIKKEVESTVNSLPEAERKNFGKVMSAAMGKLKGKADGAVIAKIVKELCSQ